MPFNLLVQGLSRADGLRSLVMAVITDDRAPVSVRNHCHRLMLAIERNNQTLIDESLISLERAAEGTGYQLPQADPLDGPNLDLDPFQGAPAPHDQS